MSMYKPLWKYMGFPWYSEILNNFHLFNRYIKKKMGTLKIVGLFWLEGISEGL